MNVGSICTGYGGLELGLDLAGINHRLEWVSEIDPTANTVLNHHWPDVPNIGDINHATPAPVDLITAGFPCQDISVAGQQAGIHGDRSGLWWTIRDVISDLRPQWVLLENVAAILTNGGPAVIGSLTKMGYHCRWGIVRASDAGAPHQRARWFCSATNTGSVGRPSGQQIHRPGSAEIERDSRGPTADADGERQQSVWGSGLQPGQRDTNGRAGAIVADPPSVSGNVISTSRSKQHQQHIEAGRRNCDVGLMNDGRFEAAISAWGKYGPAVATWAAIIGRLPPSPAINGRLNPRAVEWMMGLPDQWTNHGTRAAQLRCLGNGVVPQQAALAIRTLIKS